MGFSGYDPGLDALPQDEQLRLRPQRPSFPHLHKLPAVPQQAP